MDNKPIPWHQKILVAINDQLQISWYSLLLGLIHRWPTEFQTIVAIKFKERPDGDSFINYLIEVPAPLRKEIDQIWKEFRKREARLTTPEQRARETIRYCRRISGLILTHLEHPPKNQP